MVVETLLLCTRTSLRMACDLGVAIIGRSKHATWTRFLPVRAQNKWRRVGVEARRSVRGARFQLRDCRVAPVLQQCRDAPVNTSHPIELHFTRLLGYPHFGAAGFGDANVVVCSHVSPTRARSPRTADRCLRGLPEQVSSTWVTRVS